MRIGYSAFVSSSVDCSFDLRSLHFFTNSGLVLHLALNLRFLNSCCWWCWFYGWNWFCELRFDAFISSRRNFSACCSKKCDCGRSQSLINYPFLPDQIGDLIVILFSRGILWIIAYFSLRYFVYSAKPSSLTLNRFMLRIFWMVLRWYMMLLFQILFQIVKRKILFDQSMFRRNILLNMFWFSYWRKVISFVPLIQSAIPLDFKTA